MFAELDLASGYWQVLVNPKHSAKTAFATHLGLFIFLRMPFVSKTAHQTFRWILNAIFAEHLYKWLIIYIDDCIFWSSHPEEASGQYEKVFQLAVKFGVQFKPPKCELFSSDLEILGHTITPVGRFSISKGTNAITNMPRPHNVSAVKLFLGMVGYFRDYIRNMSMCTKFLRSLFQKGILFVWTSNHEAEFQDLKTAFVSPGLMLHHSEFDKPFEVRTDASKYGTGAMLVQWHDNELRPVRYASQAFTQTESHWPTAHQELFAVKWAMEHFRPYILRHPVKVITDQANLNVSPCPK